jgi:hypothetical protein
MLPTLFFALALVAPDAGGAARIEARVTATIQRGVTVQNGTVESRTASLPAERRGPRLCSTPAQPGLDCRLIVFDLP